MFICMKWIHKMQAVNGESILITYKIKWLDLNLDAVKNACVHMNVHTHTWWYVEIIQQIRNQGEFMLRFTWTMHSIYELQNYSLKQYYLIKKEKKIMDIISFCWIFLKKYFSCWKTFICLTSLKFFFLEKQNPKTIPF